MIFKFPEYGSLRWHGVLNPAWKCIFQKLEKYTPGGQTKIGSYFILFRTLPRHRRTSMLFCVWVAQAICVVSVVFDRWVAHEYVCDYMFLTIF